MRATPLLTLLAFFALAAFAPADVLMHKDGRRIEGTITSEKDNKIVIKTEFGDMTFPRADITSIERGKTRWQEFAERESACKTAEDWFQLGAWAKQRKMTKETKRCMLKAIELDPKHAAAHQHFGHVLYKDEWLTPEERDKRVQADEVAAKLASGLVEYQGRWVSAEEKSHFEKNEVLVDGKWIPFADAQRKKGLEEFGGKWMPLFEALARENADAVEKLAGVPLEELVTEDVLLCGPQPPEELTLIAGLMKTGRAWFDGAFQSKPGLELFGGRLAEFYMFDVDGSYLATCELLTGKCKTATRAWSDAIKSAHGFMCWDPYPMSSVRAYKRPIDQLRGHDLHHFGHLLLNRLGYDRRRLPPWYEEGVAALFEFKAQGRNWVFCEAPKPTGPSAPTTGGDPRSTAPVSGRALIVIDEAMLHDGQWRTAVAAKTGEIPPFEVLSAFEFHSLQGADIGGCMGIVAWLESRGEGRLRKFHDVLRNRAPYASGSTPSREQRDAVYEEAFQAAAGMGWKAADQAWRVWVAQK